MHGTPHSGRREVRFGENGNQLKYPPGGAVLGERTGGPCYWRIPLSTSQVRSKNDLAQSFHEPNLEMLAHERSEHFPRQFWDVSVDVPRHPAPGPRLYRTRVCLDDADALIL